MQQLLIQSRHESQALPSCGYGRRSSHLSVTHWLEKRGLSVEELLELPEDAGRIAECQGLTTQVGGATAP